MSLIKIQTYISEFHELIDQYSLNSGPYFHELLEACLDNVKDKENPIRVNNFSYCIRGLLDKVLKELSPENELRLCFWYESKKNKEKEQRLRYALVGGLAQKYVDELRDDYNQEIINNFLMMLDALNSYTHLDEKVTLKSDITAQEYEIIKILEITLDILRSINNIKENIQESLEAIIDIMENYTLMHALENYIESLDEISNRYSIDCLQADSIHILKIGPHNVEALIKGDVLVELHYGSNSDRANDMGVTMSDSFPFESKLKLNCDSLEDVQEVIYFQVNNSDWYE